MTEVRETREPTVAASTFAEYEPLLLTKDDLGKVSTLLFKTEPEELTHQFLSERLTEDKFIVRQKYSLPNEGIWVHEPDEYYRQLEDIARKEGVQVRSKEEFGKFFRQRLATAVYLSRQDIIAMEKMQDNDSLPKVGVKAATFEHELIHALQYRRYPRMELIRKEYEAYIAHASDNILKNEPWLFLERMALSLTIEQLSEAWGEYQAGKTETNTKS